MSRSSSDGDPLIVRRARERREGGVDGRRDSDSSAGRDRDVVERIAQISMKLCLPKTFGAAKELDPGAVRSVCTLKLGDVLGTNGVLPDIHVIGDNGGS